MRRHSSFRLKLAWSLALGFALAVDPYVLTIDHSMGFKVALVAAHAKNGGNNGNGNGGNAGAGNNGNGNGNSGSNGNSAGSKGVNGGASETGTHVNATTGDTVTVQGNSIEVRHPDGISEKIEAGRFIMRDALGRIIIDRAAKTSDLTRLRGL